MTKRDLEMEMHDSLDNTLKLAARLTTENGRMRAALLDAAAQFDLYMMYHLGKVPPDEEKTTTNMKWAARCRDAARLGQ